MTLSNLAEPCPVESATEAERYLLTAAIHGHHEACRDVPWSNPDHRILADLIGGIAQAGVPCEVVTIQNRITSSPDDGILHALVSDLVADYSLISARHPMDATISDCRKSVVEANKRRILWTLGTNLRLTAERSADTANLSQLSRDCFTAIECAGEDQNLALLDQRRIDLTYPPPKPVPLLRLQGHQICTPGNLTVVSAQAKAGKSAVVGAMIASLIAAHRKDQDNFEYSDTLGFAAETASNKAVVLFDTEQSTYDSHNLVQRAIHRSGATDTPNWLRAYRLLDIATRTRRTLLRKELSRASRECSGIQCAIIDGVADLCIDPNDSEEAFDLVEELVQLAVEHDCSLILVLHENPSRGDLGKTRGHLGSQLERKAESNLRILKDKDGISTIFSERCRSAHIPPSLGAKFRWDADNEMHLTVAKTDHDPKAKAIERHVPLVDEVFAQAPGPLLWQELKAAIMDCGIKSDSTAERRIKKWHELNLITKTGNPARYARVQPSTVKPPSNEPSLTVPSNHQSAPIEGAVEGGGGNA